MSTASVVGTRTVGGPGRPLSDETVTSFVAEALAGVDLDGATVCVVVPDGTRSCPLPLLLGAVHDALAGRVAGLTAVVALGTHAPMPDAELARWLGYDADGLDHRIRACGC